MYQARGYTRRPVDVPVDTAAPAVPRRSEEQRMRALRRANEIRSARARLLTTLQQASATLPGDEWIAGQQVRYLMEDSQPQQAARVAAQCRAVRWWCDALTGLVRHVTADYAGADSAFTAALAEMPDEERCHWNDISTLLEGEPAERYRTLDCADRAAFPGEDAASVERPQDGDGGHASHRQSRIARAAGGVGAPALRTADSR